MTDRGEFRDPFPPLLTGEESIDPSAGRIDWTRAIPQLRLVGPVWVAGQPAYLFKEQVIYTADGTFTKADYPLLRAIRVRMVAGGGAGSGSDATTASEQATATGGTGGGYAESWILADDLDETEAVTVGAGGAAGAAGAVGSAGEDSVFDTISGEVRAIGGLAGTERAANAGPGSLNPTVPPGGNVGDFVFAGGAGSHAMTFITISSSLLLSGSGGNSAWGHGGAARVNTGTGRSATGYGSGGGGAASGVSQSAQVGAAGNPGLVIVDVYV